MRGIRQHQVEVGVSQDVPHRLPVDAGPSIATCVHLLAANHSRKTIRLAVVVSNVRITLSPSASRKQATTVNIYGATAWI
jgi:hypothetical protein